MRHETLRAPCKGDSRSRPIRGSSTAVAARYPPLPGRLGRPYQRAATTPLPPTLSPERATTVGSTPLRAAGWRGSGYVRWRHPSNRGFLRSLEALRQRAEEIGEDDEEERCALFLRQLDPDWQKPERGSGGFVTTPLVGPFPPGTDPGTYDRLRRRVLWRMPAGIYLLGSAAGARRNLMTHNLAMQVATDPKMLAVAVRNDAVTHELIHEGQIFSLSFVKREDRALVRAFTKPAPEGPGPGMLGGVAVGPARPERRCWRRPLPGWSARCARRYR